MSEQTCIILAGGLGTRLQSVLGAVPKCLAPVGTQPFIEVQLSSLAAAGIGRFVLSLGHGASMIMDQVSTLRERFAIEVIVEPRQLGTGGAVFYVMANADLDECLVVNGDTYLGESLAPMLRPLARSTGERLRMATVTVRDRARYGGVCVVDGHVRGFVEKGVTGAGPINAGMYRLARTIFDGQEYGSAFSLERDIIEPLVSRAAVYAEPVGETFFDIGIPVDYEHFCSYYLSRRPSPVPSDRPHSIPPIR